MSIRPRLTFANVTSLLALFVALGGTSYAVVALPKNSVKARQVASGAIRSAEIKNRSVKARDLARGVLRAGPPGVAGPAGPAGARGPDGAPGRDGVSGYEIVSAESGLSSADKGVTVTCPEGKRATGGGYWLLAILEESVRIDYDAPVDGGRGWRVSASETTAETGSWGFAVWAVCVNA